MSKFVKSHITKENTANEYNKALDELIEESTKQVNNINNWKKITKEKRNNAKD